MFFIRDKNKLLIGFKQGNGIIRFLCIIWKENCKEVRVELGEGCIDYSRDKDGFIQVISKEFREKEVIILRQRRGDWIVFIDQLVVGSRGEERGKNNV